MSEYVEVCGQYVGTRTPDGRVLENWQQKIDEFNRLAARIAELEREVAVLTEAIEEAGEAWLVACNREYERTSGVQAHSMVAEWKRSAEAAMAAREREAPE